MPDIIQYTETAYTPNQKEQLSPPDPAVWAGSQRHYRGHPFSKRGIFCGDYRYHANASNIRSLKKGDHACGYFGQKSKLPTARTL